MHGTTSQRFEAKYLVPESVALMLRDYIEPYVAPDENMVDTAGYVVSSLYLDNESLALYWSSTLGEKNRLKLRIRTYSDHPDVPLFFEIKRRVNQVILKERSTIRRQFLDKALRGARLPDEAFVGRNLERDRRNLEMFQSVQALYNAGPRVVVYYLREAYVASAGQAVRVSFDRCLAGLHCQEESGPHSWLRDGRWLDVDAGGVILELKFTDTYPPWLKVAAQRFGLRQSSFAKYCACVNILKRRGDWMLPPFDPNQDPLWSVSP